MSLFKGHASGNDFLIGFGEEAVRLATDEELVRRLCRRRLGIGADGVLALFPESGHKVRLIYRNADGSRARFCANGTRLAALAAHLLGGLSERLTVTTDAGEIGAWVDGKSIRLEQHIEAGTCAEIEIEIDGKSMVAHHLVVGVPHLLVELSSTRELEEFDLDRHGPALRAHPSLGKEGANFHLFARRDDARLALRSFERGVETETLSCGSAAMAIGLLAGRPVDVVVASGAILTVEPGPPLRLTGPAELIAEIELRDEI